MVPNLHEDALCTIRVMLVIALLHTDLHAITRHGDVVLFHLFTRGLANFRDDGVHNVSDHSCDDSQ